VSIWAAMTSKGPSGFGYASTAEEVTEGLSLAGTTMLVTGCTSGVGRETLRVLALRGARVLGTGRTVEAAARACAGVGGDALPLACDLAEPASVRACVEVVKQTGRPLDAVICNAGVMALPTLQRAHGYERQFFTNHVGHFMLVTGLLEHLAGTGRVVVVSSSAHRRAPRAGIELDNLDGAAGYRPWTAYGQSKLANLLFAKELARRFSGSRRTANAVHPGVIRTNLQRHLNPLVAALMTALGPLGLKSVAQGAATQVFAATSPLLATVSGQYLADCNVARPLPIANDEGLARKLWEVSEQIIAALPPAPA
jgi:NAD(P)-dependent dehydrogenase (short-subunit alcohol dehydrogenase family)